jgi:hypothetical protein
MQHCNTAMSCAANAAVKATHNLKERIVANRILANPANA